MTPIIKKASCFEMMKFPSKGQGNNSNIQDLNQGRIKPGISLWNFCLTLYLSVQYLNWIYVYSVHVNFWYVFDWVQYMYFKYCIFYIVYWFQFVHFYVMRIKKTELKGLNEYCKDKQIINLTFFNVKQIYSWKLYYSYCFTFLLFAQVC